MQTGTTEPTTDDVVDRFNALDIAGFHALDFAYQKSEKLVMRLWDTDRVYRTIGAGETNDYELQFNRILGGRIEAEGVGPGKIERWRAHRHSDHLTETLRDREHLTYGESFVHFELACEQLRLDVIARDFFLTIVNKGTLGRAGPGTPEAG